MSNISAKHILVQHEHEVQDIIKKLTDNNIDCRPIVTGNFAKNEVMRFFEYEIFETLQNANYPLLSKIMTLNIKHNE